MFKRVKAQAKGKNTTAMRAKDKKARGICRFIYV